MPLRSRVLQVPAVTALRVALQLLKRKIVTSRKDKVGIMFYGVDKAKNPDKEGEDLGLDQQVKHNEIIVPF